MRVQEISGKDVHNMKARSTQQIQDLRGGRGVQVFQGCPRKGPGGSRGGPRSGAVWLGYYAATFFVQEVLVGQMAQGSLFGACRGPPPSRDFKVVGGGRGRLSQQCPTRHPRVGG